MQVRWRTRAEGRRHERVELIAPVLIITYGVTGEHYDEGVSINVSDSGVAFETEADLSSGSLVHVVFGVDQETEYRRYARLLYRFGPRYGAYFTKLD
jgi:hypothetical protein